MTSNAQNQQYAQTCTSGSYWSQKNKMASVLRIFAIVEAVAAFIIGIASSVYQRPTTTWGGSVRMQEVFDVANMFTWFIIGAVGFMLLFAFVEKYRFSATFVKILASLQQNNKTPPPPPPFFFFPPPPHTTPNLPILSSLLYFFSQK